MSSAIYIGVDYAIEDSESGHNCHGCGDQVFLNPKALVCRPYMRECSLGLRHTKEQIAAAPKEPAGDPIRYELCASCAEILNDSLNGTE